MRLCVPPTTTRPPWTTCVKPLVPASACSGLRAASVRGSVVYPTNKTTRVAARQWTFVRGPGMGGCAGTGPPRGPWSVRRVQASSNTPPRMVSLTMHDCISSEAHE